MPAGRAMPPFSLARSPQAALPTALQSGADGRRYPIDPCFRTVLMCLKRLSDPDLPALLKLLYLAKRFFLGHPPADMAALFTAFVTGGAAPEDGPALLDFEVDAGAIYASFRMQYGIDLLAEELHWLLFRELLAGLGENTPLGARARLRAMPETAVPPEERARLRRLKAGVALARRPGQAEQALLAELDRRLAAGEDPADVIRQLQEV